MKTPLRAKDKIRSRRALSALITAHRRRGERVVFTSGCFDLLHVGHLRAFEQARALGDVLVVGVNRDRRVRELKGSHRPIVPESQRAEVVAGLAVVDYVTLFDEDTPVELILELAPDVVCKGGEYRGANPPEKTAIESLGGRFALLRQIPGVRTTRIVERMQRRR